jgi:methylase of polypeptide subunit release factors
MAVFEPNLTTKLILSELRKLEISDVEHYLEVGCGSGYITESLLEEHRLHPRNVWLSDISEEAIVEARLRLGTRVTADHFKVGSCLEPWKGMKFGLIVSDVAGVSDPVAKVSSWYEGVPFHAGVDGLTNTLRVLWDARSLLTPQGRLVFPVLSLSNVDRLFSEMSSAFTTVQLTTPVLWPMPQEFLGHEGLLNDLHESGNITLIKKFGKCLASTQVAICSGAVA